MRIHNPELDWEKHVIRGWSPSCLYRCHGQTYVPVQKQESPDLSEVPTEYRDLKEAFSKSHAIDLPPHWPYHCAIDIKPGTTPPRGRLFSSSRAEMETMEKYLREALSAGIIPPSSSLAGAGFFFVKQKDGSLRSCIDYGALNDITVKNRYPLPLMTTAFD